MRITDEQSASAATAGYTITVTPDEEYGYIVLRECRKCGHITTYRNVQAVELNPHDCGYKVPVTPVAPLTRQISPTQAAKYEQIIRQPGMFCLRRDGEFDFSYRGLTVHLTFSQSFGCWLVGSPDLGLRECIDKDAPAVEIRRELERLIERTAPAWMLAPLAIPFNGELDPADAPDTTPACYGL
uniref:Uncharacterized protein n=1 Tax=viral metagenome TaxID=1070528 RepID=A0A6M3L3J0_9ZZZZ